MRFLIGGAEQDGDIPLRAEAMKALLQRRQWQSGRLWRAVRGSRCVAAAMIIHNPGRFGTVLHSPAAAPGVETQALIQLIRKASLASIEEDVSFVQTLLPTDFEEDVAIIRAAGFEALSELVYMRLELSGPARREADGLDHASKSPPAEGREQLTWRRHGQFDDAELAGVIEATYEGSLDCPGLAALRPMSDVIAGHKAGDRFCPALWWLAGAGGRAAACILVNDLPERSIAEVVYMGVVPAFRGRGLGRTLLCRAAGAAGQRNLEAVCLAVDRKNKWALRLYESAGFAEVVRRGAFILANRRGH